MLARSFQVASSLKNSGTGFGGHVFSLLNQTLRAQGKKKLQQPRALQANYSLDYVTCEDDLEKISLGLLNNPHARICCYGPPGTGKTAWANWLGEQLGMPVLLKQGSDLLGVYVGETEKNIVDAFEQATEQNMLLVLDEVDSFLFARDGAERSWERSMVNEMLTQIERFDGLLVVSTNLMHQLDYAALRRFDLKIRFSYLKEKQLLLLARQQAGQLGLPNLSDEQEERLKQMHQLAPGDFSAIARRHRFAVFDDVDAWIDALVKECELKPQESRKMGFM
ncbi:MAG: ATP-binding protein [Brachymonas sp.]|nr:ATP-binding protein [Brachymonas sp.]